jgi:hypothetical protein
LETFRNNVACLMALGSFIQTVGVLFVVGNPGTRLQQQDVKILRWLQCFCGPAFFRNVTFVTSFWDTYNKESFQQVYARMKSLYEFGSIKDITKPPGRFHGACFYHHGVVGGELTPDSYPALSYKENRAERRKELHNLIRRRYAQQEFEPVKLQFMTEVEGKVPFLKTEAANVLRCSVVNTIVKIMDDKCVVRLAGKSTDDIGPPPMLSEEPPVPEATWAQTINKWFDLARSLADFYKQYHDKSSKNFRSRVQNAFNAIRDWWSK